MIATRPLRAALLAAALLLVPAANAAAAPSHYVTMTDGASIAINVKVPSSARRHAGAPPSSRCPATRAARTTARRRSATSPTRPACRCRCRPARAPPTPRTSTTATSPCSPACAAPAARPASSTSFSWRSALDGREVIDNWIAQQPWSNGDVVIFGHSYSGLTGMMVAVDAAASTCARSAPPACSATSTATSSIPAASPTTASRCCGPARCARSTTSAAAPPAACTRSRTRARSAPPTRPAARAPSSRTR